MKTRLILLAIGLMLPGCTSLKRAYPLAGAAAGGAAGSVGGPAVAAVGAAAGYSAGELVKADMEAAEAMEKAEKKLEKAEDTIKALTTGDVDALVKSRLEEAKGSWGDKVLQEVWGAVKLAAFATAAGFLLVMVIIPLLHKHGIKTAIHRIKEELAR